jgi:hypothetical protein
MADNNPSTDNQPDEQLEQSPPLPPQQLLVPRRYLEWAYKAACSIETIAKVLNEMTAAKDCQDELPRWWSHRHDGDLLSAIEALAEGIQLRMEEPLDPAFQKNARGPSATNI